MTDEEIEKGMYACGIEAKCNNCPYIENCNKASNLVKDAFNYINRLKDERNYWKKQFEWQAEQDKNALEGERKIRKETAKEILKIVESVKHGENGMRYRNPDCVIAFKIKEKYGVEVD